MRSVGDAEAHRTNSEVQRCPCVLTAVDPNLVTSGCNWMLANCCSNCCLTISALWSSRGVGQGVGQGGCGRRWGRG